MPDVYGIDQIITLCGDEMADTNKRTNPTLSLVVPMYNESEVIDVFFQRVFKVLDDLGEPFEIVCINDGSKDDTLAKLIRKNEEDDRIKVIDLSRNFGKEVALTAGLDHALGDAVIPIDSDLQDPPELILEMFEKWREGFDVVLAIRNDRRADSVLKRNSANWFYAIMKRMGEVPIPPNAGDFRLMDRQVVEAMKRVPERTRFMKGLFAWLGFRSTIIYFARENRAAGESGWPYWKLWNFALEGLVSFSTAPLKIWTYIGVATSLAAIIYLIVVVSRTLILGVDVPGYASLMAVILFFSGLNMLSLGVIGEYLSRVFIEVKQRPLYLVRRTYGFELE